MLIDTHTHLNFNAFREDVDSVIRRTLKEGIGMILPGSQISTSKRAIALASMYPKNVYAAVGLHPIHLEERKVDVEEVQSEEMQEKPWMTFQTRGEFFDYDQYKQLAQSSKKVVAIGECGLDYYYKPKGTAKKEEFKKRQKEALVSQMKLAVELDLPIILHCRVAHEDLLGMLKEFQREYGGQLRGVLHSYAGDARQAREFLALGFFVGFNGLIFKTIQSLPDPAEVIASIPLDRILLETDAPYLTPPQAAGNAGGGTVPPTRNEPLFVRFVAERVAAIKGLPLETIAEATTKNARVLFRID